MLFFTKKIISLEELIHIFFSLNWQNMVQLKFNESLACFAVQKYFVKIHFQKYGLAVCTFQKTEHIIHLTIYKTKATIKFIFKSNSN